MNILVFWRPFTIAACLRLMGVGGGTGRVSAQLHGLVDEPDIHHLVVKFVALGEKLAMMRSHFYSAEQIRDMIAAHGYSAIIERDSQLSAWVAVEK